MKRKKILGIITKDVVVVADDAVVTDAARLMQANDIGAVVVMRDEQVVGILSERDIVRRLVLNSWPPDTTKVCDIMTREITTVDFKEGLNAIYKKLLDIDFRHLIILDDKKLVGITTRRDFLDNLVLKKR